MDELTVIIVTRNTCALTCAAVESVFASEDALIKNVVVVDNGSSDGTQASLCARFPHVRYIYSDQNLGFARANNRGARDATGTYLLLLNSDARLCPDALASA